MWYAERQIGYGQITVDTVCTYLLYLFENKTPSGKDMSSGALNRIRSSISFFLQYDFPGLGNQMPVVRLFNYFYKARPNLPRYRVTWDVGIVLRFFSSVASYGVSVSQTVDFKNCYVGGLDLFR